MIVLRLLVLIFTLALSLSVYSQKSAISPYSMYGLGEMGLPASSNASGMGGESYGIYSPYNISLSNPALAGAIQPQSVIFETGAVSRSLFLKNDSMQKIPFMHNYLSHIAIGFPLMKWWKSVVSFSPYSRMGYSVKSSAYFGGIGEASYSWYGSGEIDRLSFSHAFTQKNISAGISASFLFGDISRVSSSYISASPYANTIGTFRADELLVRDVIFSYGLACTGNLNGLNVTAGISYTPPSKVHAHFNRDVLSVTGSFFQNYSSAEVIDTLVSTSSAEFVQLPTMAGIGFSINKDDMWLVKADFTFNQWSEFASPFSEYKYRDSREFSTGVQYTPDHRATTSFWKVAHYRFGAFLREMPLTFRGTSITGHGITFGIGFPVRRSFSRINLAVEAGRMGTTAENLYREEYVKVSLILSMNDKWFIRKKID